MVNNTAKWSQGEEKKSGEEEGKGRGGNEGEMGTTHSHPWKASF